MRKAETASNKLLLLPLIPALALGIVRIATQISAPAPVASIGQAPDVPNTDDCGSGSDVCVRSM